MRKDGWPVAAERIWCPQTRIRKQIRERTPPVASCRACRAAPIPPRPSARCRHLLRTRRGIHEDPARNPSPDDSSARRHPRPHRAHNSRPSQNTALRCPRGRAALDRRRPVVRADPARTPAADGAPPLCRRAEPDCRSTRRSHPPAAPWTAPADNDSEFDQWEETGTPATSVDLDLTAIEDVTPDTSRMVPIQGGVRATLFATGASQPQLHCGDLVQLPLRLRTPERYNDPGAWQYADYLLDQNIAASASASAAKLRVLASPQTNVAASFHCRIFSAQTWAASRLLAYVRSTPNHRLPAMLRITPDDAGMLNAMLFGDRTRLTHTLRLGFERTGSFHLFVVSGMHVALLAGLLFYVARRLRLTHAVATLLTLAPRPLCIRSAYRIRRACAARPADDGGLSARTPALARPQHAQCTRRRRTRSPHLVTARTLRGQLPDDIPGHRRHRRHRDAAWRTQRPPLRPRRPQSPRPSGKTPPSPAAPRTVPHDASPLGGRPSPRHSIHAREPFPQHSSAPFFLPPNSPSSESSRKPSWSCLWRSRSIAPRSSRCPRTCSASRWSPSSRHSAS